MAYLHILRRKPKQCQSLLEERGARWSVSIRVTRVGVVQAHIPIFIAFVADLDGWCIVSVIRSSECNHGKKLAQPQAISTLSSRWLTVSQPKLLMEALVVVPAVFKAYECFELLDQLLSIWVRRQFDPVSASFILHQFVLDYHMPLAAYYSFPRSKPRSRACEICLLRT